MIDVKKMIQEMTLDEKISMVHGDGLFKTGSVSRLGIPSLKMSDGPMGVRNEFENDAWKPLNQNDDYVTYLPSISALATTWNRELARLSGQTLGEEARGRGKDIILGPGVNIKRTPLCGRNFEYFSEDPYVTVEMASPFIKGAQENDVAVCLKHFALNNQETHRMDLNVVVDDEALNNIYLRVFREIIKQGQPYSIMGSYSKIHNEFCCESPYLVNDILRSQWGYEGAYISDWGAVHHTYETATSGVDIEMSVTANFDNYYLANPLKEAIQNGQISEKFLDEKVERILHLMEKIKINDPQRKIGSYNTMQHQQAALEVARESVVLLKNEDNILPLNKKTRSILVIGENAIFKHANGGGSAEINALYEITPLLGMKMLLGGQTQIDYVPGYKSVKKLTEEDAHPDSSDLNWQADSLSTTEVIDNGEMSAEEKYEAAQLRKEAVAKAVNYDTVIFVGGLNHDFDVENQDRSSMQLPYEQETLILELLAVKPDMTVVLIGGSPVELEKIVPQTKALMFMYYAGAGGGLALAENLFGDVNPSGHLTETFPYRYEDTPVAKFGDFPGDKEVTYREGSFVGYRYYDTFNKKVAFPFGFGLSYSNFEYSKVDIVPKDETVKLTIANVSECDGKALVQVYQGAKDRSSSKPSKELVQFEKVFVQSGQQKEVTLKLEKSNFDKGLTIYVGTSAKDIFYSKTIL